MADSYSAQQGFQVDRLQDGRNYDLWAERIKAHLIQLDVWSAVTDEKPTGDPQKEAKWVKHDNKARSIIINALSDKQLIRVIHEPTSRQMWTSLLEINRQESIKTKILLMRQLYRIEMKPQEKLKDHIANFMELTQKLRSLGKEIQDEDLAIILLSSLPQSYTNIVHVLEMRESLSLNYVLARLQEESFSKLDHISEPRELALRVSSRRDFSCSVCRKKGHLKEDCWFRDSQRVSKQPPRWMGTMGFRNANAAIKSPNADGQRKSRSDKNCLNVGKNDQNICKWAIDSACTNHLCNNEKFFNEMNESHGKLYTANGEALTAQGQGTVSACCALPSGQTREVQITDCLYVPELKSNLISVSAMAKKGIETVFKGEKCFISNEGELIAQGTLEDGLYMLDCSEGAVNLIEKCTHKNCTSLVHRRLGHANMDYIYQLERQNLTNDLQMRKCPDAEKCVCCIQAKGTRPSFTKQSEKQTTRPLELIHSDVCGPMGTVTPSGKYIALKGFRSGTLEDYRCWPSYSHLGCMLSVHNAEEAADICCSHSQCQHFIITPQKTWTGRSLALFQSSSADLIPGNNTVVYVKRSTVSRVKPLTSSQKGYRDVREEIPTGTNFTPSKETTHFVSA